MIVNNISNINRINTSHASKITNGDFNQNIKSSQIKFTGAQPGIITKILSAFKSKPQTPVQEFTKYMNKGFKAIYSIDASKMYCKAVNVLLENWSKLDVNEQTQLVKAYLKLASSDAVDSTTNGLNRLKGLYTNLSELNSPLAKDSKVLAQICINANEFAKLALQRENLRSAENCYKFAKSIAEYSDANHISKFTFGKEDAAEFFTKKINALKELRSD